MFVSFCAVPRARAVQAVREAAAVPPRLRLAQRAANGQLRGGGHAGLSDRDRHVGM